MLLLYNFFLFLYRLVIRISSLTNPKAKKWIDGRKDWAPRMRQSLSHKGRRIWVHCSSVGEFEQARPLIEALKTRYPGYQVLLTFFSPSGYEACKNYKLADNVLYLPGDSAANARTFLSLAQPELAIFIKYEFWYHYLAELHRQKIPTLLVSGAFRQQQLFFKGYGGVFRNMLQYFTWFFVQDAVSESLLKSIGITHNVQLAGDTRYDRVSVIASSFVPIPAIESFRGSNKLLIAGSTWPGDEAVLKDCLDVLPTGWKLVIVPHEIDKPHIDCIQALFGPSAVLFSQLGPEETGESAQVLVVNNMGMLSRLFYYGEIAFIGGGFQKGGIHNVLEPAVYGLPVITGPVYEKFVEAKALVGQGCVFPVPNSAACRTILQKLVADEGYRKEIGATVKTFMAAHTGATARVMQEIEKQQWLK